MEEEVEIVEVALARRRNAKILDSSLDARVGKSENEAPAAQLNTNENKEEGQNVFYEVYENLNRNAASVRRPTKTDATGQGQGELRRFRITEPLNIDLTVHRSGGCMYYQASANTGHAVRQSRK